MTLTPNEVLAAAEAVRSTVEKDMRRRAVNLARLDKRIEHGQTQLLDHRARLACELDALGGSHGRC